MTSTSSDAAEACFCVASKVGPAWKRCRRSIPPSVKCKFAELLFELRLFVLPRDVVAASAIGEARYDVRGLVELMVELAKRPSQMNKQVSKPVVQQVKNGLRSLFPSQSRK